MLRRTCVAHSVKTQLFHSSQRPMYRLGALIIRPRYCPPTLLIVRLYCTPFDGRADNVRAPRAPNQPGKIIESSDQLGSVGG
eukprot:6917818-Pyramimonas_sp.AAC.1